MTNLVNFFPDATVTGQFHNKLPHEEMKKSYDDEKLKIRVMITAVAGD